MATPKKCVVFEDLKDFRHAFARAAESAGWDVTTYSKTSDRASLVDDPKEAFNGVTLVYYDLFLDNEQLPAEERQLRYLDSVAALSREAIADLQTLRDLASLATRHSSAVFLVVTHYRDVPRVLSHLDQLRTRCPNVRLRSKPGAESASTALRLWCEDVLADLSEPPLSVPWQIYSVTPENERRIVQDALKGVGPVSIKELDSHHDALDAAEKDTEWADFVWFDVVDDEGKIDSQRIKVLLSAAKSNTLTVFFVPVRLYASGQFPAELDERPNIKPLFLGDRTKEAISAAVRNVMSELEQYRWSEWGNRFVVGTNTELRKAVAKAERIAPKDLDVLLQGETGTGKEVLARYIHRRSCRCHGRFRAINCAALSETLLESELFGHRKGAFTGAIEDRDGLFVEARGGTVFLDEIADASRALQAKLLRALDGREVLPVGGRDPVRFDARVIAATNRNLEDEVRAGRFREDLWYRLCVVPIHVPALRDRPDDLPLLVKWLLQTFADTQGSLPKQLTAEAMQAIVVYRWPGNVRELRNALLHASALASGSEIPASLLPESVIRPSNQREGPRGEGAAPPTHLGCEGESGPLLVEWLAQLFLDNQLQLESVAKRLGLSPEALEEILREKETKSQLVRILQDSTGQGLESVGRLLRREALARDTQVHRFSAAVHFNDNRRLRDWILTRIKTPTGKHAFSQFSKVVNDLLQRIMDAEAGGEP